METGFERVLVDIEGRKPLVTVGKDGILWKLARDTGQFVDFTETLSQTSSSRLDKGTGKLSYREDISRRGSARRFRLPGIYGGHNWQATAYHPETETLIIPLHQFCVEMVGQSVEMKEGGGGYGGESVYGTNAGSQWDAGTAEGVGP